jgi:hypothetical protein
VTAAQDDATAAVRRIGPALVCERQGSEMWPRHVADVTTLIPVIDRLRQRFGIGRICAKTHLGQ